MKQIVIQSNKENIVRAEELVYDICDEYNVQNYIGIITVAVMHAIENAMCHGNHHDPSKNVTIEWGACKGGLYFQITDQGDGFDFSSFKSFPESTSRGEGVFMMTVLADKVEYTNEGRSVRLEFKIEGIDKSDCDERCETLMNFFNKTLVNA